MQGLAGQTILELAPLIQAKEISPRDLLAAVLSRIETYDGKLNSFIRVDLVQAEEAALTAEEEIARGSYRSPLHGMPVAIKDNMMIQDEVITLGSKSSVQTAAKDDATVVKRLKQAGAIILGTLNMDEYAVGITADNPHYGSVRNPWSLEYSAGGSSGGAAAAVAADLTFAALGTDTGGSIRIPAAACGVIGMRPTYGRISRYGVYPLAPSLDTVGPLTKSVADAALLLRWLAGSDLNDATTSGAAIPNYLDELEKPITDLVIGYDETVFDLVHPDVKQLLKQAVDQYQHMGVRVRPVTFNGMEEAYEVQTITLLWEIKKNRHLFPETDDTSLSESVRQVLKLSEWPQASTYQYAAERRSLLREAWAEIFNKVDAVLLPSLPFAAPRAGLTRWNEDGQTVDYSVEAARFMVPGSVAGLPCITVPCGFVTGLPIGMQLMGAFFAEEKLFRLAHAYEQSTNWHRKKPQDFLLR